MQALSSIRTRSVAPNLFIERTPNSRPRYGSYALLPSCGLLLVAAHVARWAIEAKKNEKREDLL